MTTRRAVLLVAALAAIAVSAVLVLSPITVRGVDCGTPLAPRSVALTDGNNGETVSSSDCSAAANDRKVPGLVLAGIGAILLVGVASNAEWVDRPWGHPTAHPS